MQPQTLVQVYDINFKRIEEHSFHGFGDYVRGCIFLYDFCIQNGILFDTCIKSDLSLFLKSTRTVDNKIIYISDIPQALNDNNFVKMFLKKILENNIENNFVFCNTVPTGWGTSTYSLMNETKTFIKTHVLNYNDEFNKHYELIRKKLNLNNYTVLHIRLYDKFIFEKNMIDLSIVEKVKSIINDNNIINGTNRVLLVSNSKKLVDNLKIENNTFETTDFETCHLGHPSSTLEEIFNTLVEFKLISNSKFIYTISQYEWISNFVYANSIIHDIPIKSFQI